MLTPITVVDANALMELAKAPKRTHSAEVGTSLISGYAGVRGKHEFNVMKGE